MFVKKIYEPLQDALVHNGIETAHPFQKTAISKIKSGADFWGIAPEGAGKTTTIVVSVIQKLQKAVDDVPRTVIVVADRDKADQLAEEFKKYGELTNLRIFTAYKGKKLMDLRDDIYIGSDVVIGTADILNEVCSLNGLNLSGLQQFIIDDAHLVFRNKGVNDNTRLVQRLPKSQHIIFSEKRNPALDHFVEEHLFVSNITKAEE